ncbi:MAG: hypothetical protein ABFS10_12155 [Bacteroidota bacterium]
MTVDELINKLRDFPPDHRVIIPGYEDGYNDITIIKKTEIIPDYFTEWYYGQHLDKDDFLKVEKIENPAFENSVLLNGENLLAEDR